MGSYSNAEIGTSRVFQTAANACIPVFNACVRVLTTPLLQEPSGSTWPYIGHRNVVCPGNPVDPSDHSSPLPSPNHAAHTSLSRLSTSVYTDNLFVPNPPPSPSPSSSSGTVSSPESSPHLPLVEHFAGDDYSYPYVSLVEPQKYAFSPNPGFDRNPTDLARKVRTTLHRLRDRVLDGF